MKTRLGNIPIQQLAACDISTLQCQCWHNVQPFIVGVWVRGVIRCPVERSSAVILFSKFFLIPKNSDHTHIHQFGSRGSIRCRWGLQNCRPKSDSTASVMRTYHFSKLKVGTNLVLRNIRVFSITQICSKAWYQLWVRYRNSEGTWLAYKRL